MIEALKIKLGSKSGYLAAVASFSCLMATVFVFAASDLMTAHFIGASMLLVLVLPMLAFAQTAVGAVLEARVSPVRIATRT